MSTKIYLESNNLPPTSPAPASFWTVISSLFRFEGSPTKLGSPMTNFDYSDGDATQQNIIIGQWISPLLDVGQTITGGQTISLQARFSETAAANNLFMNWGIRIMNGVTNNKTLVSNNIDNTEIDSTTLTNRTDSATSIAGNYTTVLGDRIVIEVGVEGDPAGTTHGSTMSIGSNSATDLPSDNTTTAANNPNVIFADTLTFGSFTTSTSASTSTSSTSSSTSTSQSTSTSLSTSSTSSSTSNSTSSTSSSVSTSSTSTSHSTSSTSASTSTSSTSSSTSISSTSSSKSTSTSSTSTSISTSSTSSSISTSTTLSTSTTTTCLDLQVSGGNNDSEQVALGININSNPTSTNADARIGWRFTNVIVPPASTITGAFLKLFVAANTSANSALGVQIEDVANAVAYTNNNNDLSTRTVTGNINFPTDTSSVTIGSFNTSPNLSSIVQTVIDRNDWVSGNALSFITIPSGAGTTTFEMYEGIIADAAELHLCWSNVPQFTTSTSSTSSSTSTSSTSSSISTSSTSSSTSISTSLSTSTSSTSTSTSFSTSVSSTSVSTSASTSSTSSSISTSSTSSSTSFSTSSTSSSISTSTSSTSTSASTSISISTSSTSTSTSQSTSTSSTSQSTSMSTSLSTSSTSISTTLVTTTSTSSTSNSSSTSTTLIDINFHPRTFIRSESIHSLVELDSINSKIRNRLR